LSLQDCQLKTSQNPKGTIGLKAASNPFRPGFEISDDENNLQSMNIITATTYWLGFLISLCSEILRFQLRQRMVINLQIFV
jgi:hypothetical protein